MAQAVIEKSQPSSSAIDPSEDSLAGGAHLTSIPGPLNFNKEADRKHGEIFTSAIYKVLQQVYPDQQISRAAMAVLDSLIYDIFWRISTEASKLAALRKQSTITFREVRASVRLVYPGGLAKHATSEGDKALTHYSFRKAYSRDKIH